MLGRPRREQQVLQRIAQFREAWAQRQAVEEQGEGEGRLQPKSSGRLLEPPLALKNECGVDKAVCTTLRPTRLPHTDLHDLEGAVQVGVWVAQGLQHSTVMPGQQELCGAHWRGLHGGEMASRPTLAGPGLHLRMMRCQPRSRAHLLHNLLLHY